MDKELLHFYVDGLLGSFSHTTATGISQASNGTYSHDAITRFLATGRLSSQDLWYQVKPLIRSIECGEGVVSIDDTISEKPYMDENEIVCWHYDHASGQYVKGINIVSAMYHAQDVSIPVAFTIVKKDTTVIDPKTSKEKRVSQETKNDHFRRMLGHCRKNIKFSHVLGDTWYGSVDNMKYIKQELHKEFIFPLKSNRKVALSAAHKRAGQYVKVDTLSFKAHEAIKVYLEGLWFPVLLMKHVYTNVDGSHGTLYLSTSDRSLTQTQMLDLYHKRWKIEEYHKALKQECSLEKSPAHTVKTQSSHIFCSICAFVKLELLHKVTTLSYEGLKLMLHRQAIRTTFKILRSLLPWDWTAKPRFA
jgi:hypothetical protein